MTYCTCKEGRLTHHLHYITRRAECQEVVHTKCITHATSHRLSYYFTSGLALTNWTSCGILSTEQGAEGKGTRQAGRAGGASQPARETERKTQQQHTTHNINTTHNDTHTLHTTSVAPTYLGRAPYPPTYLPHTVWHTAQQLVNTNTTHSNNQERRTLDK